MAHRGGLIFHTLIFLKLAEACLVVRRALLIELVAVSV